MKTCSKCNRALPPDCFVKSERYLDGLYPSCKECRKKVRDDRLSKNPMCCRCKTERHLKSQPYCYRCSRIASGRPPERIRRRALSPDLCPVCNERPKSGNHSYCLKCKGQMHKNWMKSKGGQWAYSTMRGTRHKLVARAYVNHLVQRHQLIPQPCEVCGNLEVEAHHNSYENPLDIRWICKEHHDALERWIRMKRKKSVDRTPALP